MFPSHLDEIDISPGTELLAKNDQNSGDARKCAALLKSGGYVVLFMYDISKPCCKSVRKERRPPDDADRVGTTKTERRTYGRGRRAYAVWTHRRFQFQADPLAVRRILRINQHFPLPPRPQKDIAAILYYILIRPGVDIPPDEFGNRSRHTR